MGKSREIKKRMKAVGNIRRITRTMQMIATSKFARAQQASIAGRPYTDALFGLVGELASGEAAAEHPLLRRSAEGGNELTLVITSDRGLCGPYNGSIVRTSIRHLREHPAASDGTLEVVGKKGVAAMKFAKRKVNNHLTLGDKPSYQAVEQIAQRYIDRFVAGEVSAVRVVYMRFFSAGRQAPEILQLLPFEQPQQSGATGGGSNQQYEFSPSPEALLDRLVPAAVKATLFQCVKDAIVSEHVARMVAMKAATDNAGKMRNRLKRDYNRARQAQITTELTEIISGAAALD